MKISIEDLARFGMDRVGVYVQITPSDNGGKSYGVQVKTTPYINNDVVATVQSIVDNGLETGVLNASAFMTTDGSLSCKGFTSQARGQLATILGAFSSGYRKIIEFQEKSLQDALRIVAREAAQYMLYSEPTNGFGVRMHFCLAGGDITEDREQIEKEKDGKPTIHFVDQLTGIIDNADFLAWHHARLQKAVEPMVIEELRLQLPTARDELTQRLESFDRIAIKLDTLEDDRTNPTGARRS